MSEEIKSAMEIVANGDLVHRLYGYWPSFHDAEIVAIYIDFPDPKKGTRANATLRIRHCGQDNPEWTGPMPCYVIEFLCKNVTSPTVAISDAGSRGWINEINIERHNNGLIDFDVRPASGVDIHLFCDSVEVSAIYSSTS